MEQQLIDYLKDHDFEYVKLDEIQLQKAYDLFSNDVVEDNITGVLSLYYGMYYHMKTDNRSSASISDKENMIEYYTRAIDAGYGQAAARSVHSDLHRTRARGAKKQRCTQVFPPVVRVCNVRVASAQCEELKDDSPGPAPNRCVRPQPRIRKFVTLLKLVAVEICWRFCPLTPILSPSSFTIEL